MTEVKFVKNKSGDFKGSITAVFPYLNITHLWIMGCYSHVGQHSDCTASWLTVTVSATEAEYKELLDELVSIGYDDLKIIKRIDWTKHLEAYENSRS